MTKSNRTNHKKIDGNVIKNLTKNMNASKRMKITRMDNREDMFEGVNFLEIEINGKKFKLSEDDGVLRIFTNEKIYIHPCASNGVEIFQSE